MASKILLLQLSLSLLVFINWLQHHLIPCPFKYLTGIDCPLCGFQRAVISLIQGHLRESFLLYPPAIPVLLFFGYLLAKVFFKIDNPKGAYQRNSFIALSAIVLVSYGFKIWFLYHH